MRRSIIALIIVSAFVAGGGVAFARQPRTSASEKPAASASTARLAGPSRVYTPTAPRFNRAANPRSVSSQRLPGLRKLPSGVTARSRGSQFGERQKPAVKPAQPSQAHMPPAARTREQRASKWSHSDRTGKSKIDAQTAKRLREWRGKSDSVAQAHEKHRKHGKHHRDHDWWRHQCDVIVLIGWGYWGWHAGWWYPAWGYDPYYSYYEYDGPIYSYDGLPPDQIIANVQGALQQLGYYRYDVDGVLGPLTQAALKNYQRDHGLAITGAIDPQTLTSLGFTA